METFNADMNEEEIKLEIDKKKKFIENLSLNDLLLRMEKSFEGTNVILEGYNLVNNISEGHGIAVAGILMLRESLAEAIDWMSFNLLEDDENLEESEEL